MNRRALLPICILALALAVSPVSAETIAFGDSLTDSGNMYLASGATMPPSPYYYEGRYSNGFTWVERLDYLGLAAPVPSLSPGGGTNYAFAGAETGAGSSPLGMTAQVAAYLATSTPSELNWHFLFGGANDFFNGQTDPTIPAANVASLIQTLYDAGARKFFVLNLPPLGQTPEFREGPYEGAMDALSQGYNVTLAAYVDGLRANPDITINEIDVHGLFSRCIADPGAFGLTNVTDPAFDEATGQVVGNADEYLFWDTVHPTATGHQILANHVPEPSTATLLLVGVALLIASRKRSRTR
jgi:phospholipase/lecithinase/hemolysin